MARIALIFGYYDQPRMLARQLEHIASWPAKLREHWRLIVVDDGSPNHPAELTSDPGIEASIYRISVDVPWNVEGARNVGAQEADTDWLLVTDIDHLVPVETAAVLTVNDYSERIVYSFTRRLLDGTTFRPHCNSFFLSRKLWDRIGGCDERLSGHYGGSNEWAGRARVVADAMRMIPLDLIMVRPEEVPDAWVNMTRRYEGDAEVRRELREAIKESPGPKTLSFPYERVA